MSRLPSGVGRGRSQTLSPVDATFSLPTEDLRAGRFEQAAKRLRAAQAAGFKLDSRITRALTARADTLEELDRPEDALRPARLAVELFPQSWRARAHLGDTYQALDHSSEAPRAFRHVQRLNPARAEWAQVRVQTLEQTRGDAKQ